MFLVSTTSRIDVKKFEYFLDDTRGQMGFFPSHFQYLYLTSFFPSVFASRSASNRQVSENLKYCSYVFYDVRNAMDGS